MVEQGELLWTPDADRRDGSRVAAFMRWLAAEQGRGFASYADLHAWSVTELEDFWSAFTRWIGVRWSTAPVAMLGGREMPAATWFPGGRVNYAEHLLHPMATVEPTAAAVVVAREDGTRETLTWEDLRARVASLRSWLQGSGVRSGDRVAALLPNGWEAIVGLLASASLGAVWSSCSPDFGARAVADRFVQIEPTVLLAVDGYRYGGREHDVLPVVRTLRESLPSLRATVLVGGLDPQAALDGATPWSDVMATPGVAGFEPVPADHPLWVLYSSGTTGLPKAIVHSHGGILVEHAKQLALHLDLGPGSRFFWFTTTGWMMWNLLVSGLAVGASIVLYDGNPGHPEADALWRLAADTGITCFGVGAPYLQAGAKAGLTPGEDHDLSALRTVGSTGAPLPPEGFAWVYEHVKSEVMLSSLSGGTDVCSAFVGGVPLLEVRAGEIPCALLGCAVAAYDATGQPVVGEVGELVVTEPLPSMPVGFWGDADGSRLREAYFDVYPGVWRHGDWITMTDRGSCVISGRSDSTLNRGGVRMGTSEFYRVVEELPEVLDSLVVDTSAADTAAVGKRGRLLLFVVLAEDATLDEVAATLRTRIRGQLSPRHVPDDVIAVEQVPRTLNGKKCEVPVKRVLAGELPDSVVAAGALRDPSAMDAFVAMASAVEPR